MNNRQSKNLKAYHEFSFELFPRYPIRTGWIKFRSDKWRKKSVKNQDTMTAQGTFCSCLLRFSLSSYLRNRFSSYLPNRTTIFNRQTEAYSYFLKMCQSNLVFKPQLRYNQKFSIQIAFDSLWWVDSMGFSMGWTWNFQLRKVKLIPKLRLGTPKKKVNATKWQ